MNSIELKNEIKFKISHLEDENLLNVINEILNTEKQTNSFELTDFELKRAESGRNNQIKGTLIPNEQVRENAERWLKSK
jgi:hypothetical protein